MTNKLGFHTLLMVLVINAGMVQAGQNDKPLVPLPSVLDFSRGQGWGIALGAGVEYESAYDGSDEYEFEIEPAGAIHYRDGDNLYFWEGIELGWRGRVSQSWLLQAGVRYEGGREADDSDEGKLDGLEDRDNVAVGVLEVRSALDDRWSNWIGGRIMAGNSEFGMLGVIAAGHRFGNRSDGLGTEAFLFATFGNSDFFNRDFGINAQESANSGKPETDLSGGYRSLGLTLVDRRYIADNVQLITQAGFEYYDDSIQDSPLAEQDYEAEVGVSVVYHFDK